VNEQLTDLLYQMLETEMGGVQVYKAAIQCAVNDDLKEEWEKYLDQTMNHEQVLRDLFERLGLDAGVETPGRKVVRHIGKSLVMSMEMAQQGGKPEAAELVACEAVVSAETKDHLNWELLSKYAQSNEGDKAEALQAACDAVEDEEDEHVYHSKGWCRELWIQALGMPAVLPPPEEEQDVKTRLEAAQAEASRKTR
jgi:glycine/serine hydroxymethyltransferase